MFKEDEGIVEEEKGGAVVQTKEVEETGEQRKRCKRRILDAENSLFKQCHRSKTYSTRNIVSGIILTLYSGCTDGSYTCGEHSVT